MRRVLLAFLPPDGGVAEHVRSLAEHMPAHGFRAEVAGPPDALVYPRLEAAGIRVHRLPFVRGLAAPGSDLKVLAALSRLARRGGFDLVHAHDLKAGVHGRLAARLAGIPAVYTPHSLGFVGDIPRHRRLLADVLERGLRPLTGALVCVCEDERRLALRHRLVPERRLRVVYNGCERCDGEAAPDPTLAKLRESGPLAGVVAVLREQKTVDVFLDAAPLVLERLPEARLAVVGNGRLREQLESQAARLGLAGDERFAFVPFAPPASRYLRALDVFVQPSSWEAFPISILEALACGVPQVATDVGGTREAVAPSTGLLVPARSPAAMAEAISALLEDEARRTELARASRERHAARFDIEPMVEQTAAVYHEVLEAAAR
jgi:glycosyltransferase involved in cell wall biosynthesis